MQRPYTVRDMVERAGSGDHQAPPPSEQRCAGCGDAIPVTRTYCERRACRSRWATTGRSTRRKVEADPEIAAYSW